jgi:hypothetical protein
MKRIIAGLVLAFGLVTSTAPAADEKLSGIPTAAEMPFVSAVSADLQARFPTPESARQAGYVRYTDEDNTGAISYANRRWTSVDQAHPSQLWYDVNGRLLGADFSILQADSAAAPQKFGVDPRRWTKFGAHVHFGLVGPNGTTKYGGAGPKTYADPKLAGANFQRPDASDFVKAGVVKSVKDVRFTFFFPAIWDLQVWVLTNTNGAFAETNPDVKPVKGGGTS